MRYLILIAGLTSCSLLPEKVITRKQNKSLVDKKVECLYRLIEKSGIEALKAESACTSIHKEQ